MEAATSILPARYRDVKLVAHGAMGDIYRATDSTLGRVVAVKVLREAFLGDDGAQKRFAREARAAARVSNHPNIVMIYDVGEARGRPYFVMEHMTGGSLDQRLRNEGAQPPMRVVRWIDQAARALDHAHAHGIVHRDVKPGNLLLDDENDVRVGDFGIASAAGMASLTAAGTVLGTAGYLAPEMATGERATPASDRYGLAVVAYELLTGHRPFERESPTAEAAAHVHAPVPSVSERSHLPPTVDAVFERALAKDPADRYASGAEFVAGLRHALEASAQSTRTYPVTAPAVSAPSRRPAAPRLLVAAALGGALVLGIVLAAVLFKDHSETRAAPTAREKPTTSARATPTTTAAPSTTPSTVAAPSGDPHQLNDEAWSLMKRGRYSEALPLLQQAVPALQGTGPGDLYEGYANYNLGFTLLQLGRCDEAEPYLQHAQQLEPDRAEVSRALASVEECSAPGSATPKKHGKEKHEGHD